MEVTELLVRYSSGDNSVSESLFQLVYQELKRLAVHYMKNEKGTVSLQPTVLVHEAYLRMVGDTEMHYENRNHFFATAAQQMRRLLIDHARHRLAQKRGSGEQKLTFNEEVHQVGNTDEDQEQLLLLDGVLKQFEKIDPRKAKLVELRYFAGLTIEETAEVMELSPATIKREWLLAKAWLLNELSKGEDG